MTERERIQKRIKNMYGDHASDMKMIFHEISTEIQQAVEKHPTWPKSPVERAAIVSEEAGEVIREANHIREGVGDLRLLRDELIQCAGTCIRMLMIMRYE